MSMIRPSDNEPVIDGPMYADRVRVYPMEVHGIVRRVKWAILILCLTVYYLLPWIRYNRGPGVPDQAVLLDVFNRRFYFFWMEFWPQDIYLLAGLLILAAVSLFLVTSLFGRMWCGYTCPQTVWTDLFMWVERTIEGDRNERMKRDNAKLSWAKAWRKILKHGLWLFIAAWTGGAWIMYYVDAPTLVREYWTLSASMEVYLFTGIFTATTYLLAGGAREQVCTFMCPWPRFQAAMLDEQSIIVTYQAWRGEPRGHGKRTPDTEGGAAQLGNCIDCRACVNVCPTGIDIRDGVQLECINCGLCIDACDTIMEKTKQPKRLITWDTLANQAAKKEGRHGHLQIIRPRSIIYLGVLTVGIIAMGLGLWMRPSIAVEALHDRAPLFIRLAKGDVRNGYTIVVSNKTTQPITFRLTLDGLPGAKMTLGDSGLAPSNALDLPVPKDSVVDFRVYVAAAAPNGEEGSERVVFNLYDPNSANTASHRSVFLGPQSPKGGR